MEELQTTVYRTLDGREFTNKAEAEKHEAAVAEREEQTTFWHVTHHPDLTEGRGWYGSAVLEVYVATKWWPVLALVEDYCARQFGRRVQFVQGCSAMEGWMLTKLDDRAMFDRQAKGAAQVGDYKYPTKTIKLRIGEKEVGLVVDES